MSENISLKIFTPDKTALNTKVAAVVLPYGKVNLTVVANRAPTSLMLKAGMLKILDNDGNITDIYFIDGGIADIADNVCTISTPHFIARHKIDMAKALELKNGESDNSSFYQMIIDSLIELGD
jgi:F-type H+-transporting ATPase subunit epsilon